jgi:hypothetical protein
MDPIKLNDFPYQARFVIFNLSITESERHAARAAAV